MTSDPLVEFNLGFGGRMFLSRDEWATYRRRKPVRYIRRNHGAKCAVCGNPASPDNPFQHAHQIGFKIGVIYLGLTPDYVDSKENIVTAHRRSCNQAAELDLRAPWDVCRLLELLHFQGTYQGLCYQSGVMSAAPSEAMVEGGATFDNWSLNQPLQTDKAPPGR